MSVPRRSLLALLAMFPLLLAFEITGKFIVTTMQNTASGPTVGAAPLVVATNANCCADVGTCPLTHGFDLQTNDLLYVVCHVRDNGAPFVEDSTNVANAIDVETAGSRVSLAGAWIRHSGAAGGNVTVECTLPGAINDMVTSAMQIRNAVATGDPVDNNLDGQGSPVTSFNCPSVATATDNTLVVCSAVGRYGLSSSPNPLYTDTPDWSPFDIEGDPSCTSSGFAGQVYIPNFTPTDTTPAEPWVQVQAGEILAATVAFKP